MTHIGEMCHPRAKWMDHVTRTVNEIRRRQQNPNNDTSVAPSSIWLFVFLRTCWRTRATYLLLFFCRRISKLAIMLMVVPLYVIVNGIEAGRKKKEPEKVNGDIETERSVRARNAGALLHRTEANSSTCLEGSFHPLTPR